MPPATQMQTTKSADEAAKKAPDSKTLPDSEPLKEWARRVVARRLAVLERELSRLERKPDPDAIHDLRVATRRLRAALRHLEPCFRAEEARGLRATARQLASLLGEARDLDILMKNLARDAARPGSPFAGLVARLRAQREDKLRRALPEASRLRGQLPGWKERLVS